MSSTNFFARQAAAFSNDMRRSCGALLGIAQGVLSDSALNESEIAFLDDWLTQNKVVAAAWPGNVIHARIREARRDGVITSDERAHLMNTLQDLIGGKLHELADSAHVTALALDQVSGIEFESRGFCLTGDFVYGARETCASLIERRGGVVKGGVSKKVAYLVVGGLGSDEWKHGSFGTKIERAMQMKQEGVPIKIVHEDAWAAALFG